MSQGPYGGGQNPSGYGPPSYPAQGYVPQAYPPSPPGPPPKKPRSALATVLMILGGLFVLGIGSCVVCVAVASKTVPAAVPSPSAAAAIETASASAPTTMPPPKLERGHAPFYKEIAQLVKDPKGAPPKSEVEETSNAVAYEHYTYGSQPLGIPINNLEVWVRKSNAAAWMVIVRPEDDPGLFVDDFAPAGGTQVLGTDMKDTLEESMKSGTMTWSLTSGPLKGSVVVLRMDKTFMVESHAQAYPHT